MSRLVTDAGLVVLHPPRVFAERSLLASEANLPGLNAYTVAHCLYMLEDTLSSRSVNRIVLPLYEPRGLQYDLDELAACLRDLVLFVFARAVTVEFKPVSLRGAKKAAPPAALEHVANLCLFSGGVDSFAGILQAYERFGSVDGVFWGHADQSKIIRIVTSLHEQYLAPRGIGLRRLPTPPVGAIGYRQLRGFFYIVATGAWLQLLDASRLIVSECGPTMYQPRFGPLDSITLTTQPVIVALAARVLSLLLRRPIELDLPFEDCTKAEVIAMCPDSEGLRFTHSCISQRFGLHDGTCYGCVIRRLGSLAAGRPDVVYQRDPLTDSRASGGNLLSLLVFSADVLMRYGELEEFQVEAIEAFGKRDLFERFALDNFAAVRRLVKARVRLRASVRQLYREVIGGIGEERLDARLAVLRRDRESAASPLDRSA